MKQSLDVNTGEEAFLCDSVTISHNSAMFILDLRQNIPVFIPEHGNVTIKQTHKTVVLAAGMAKELRRVLDAQIGQYEKEHGKIKISEPKVEKPSKTRAKDDGFGHHYG